MTRSRLPERLLLRKQIDDEFPVAESIGWDWLPKRGQTRLVREQHAHRDAILAVLGKLRPMIRNAIIERELVPRDQDVRAQRGRALGARPHDADGVALPCASRC